MTSPRPNQATVKPRPLRVALVGNLAGVSNEPLLGLRRRGIAADLFIFRDQQEATLEDLKGQAAFNPAWIFVMDPPGGSEGKPPPRHLRWWWGARLAKRLMGYDLLQIHTGSLAYFRLTHHLFIEQRRRPYLAMATGSDLREVAAIQQDAEGERMRTFFRNAGKTFVYNLDLFPVAQKLGISPLGFFPFTLDTAKYTPRPQVPRPPTLEGKLLCFMMSRLDFGQLPGGGTRVGAKANHRFFEALARFVKTNPQTHAIVLDRGEDRAAARRLVTALGLETFVTFKSPMTELDRIEHLQMADVVIDQFDLGSLGLGGLEAMSTGKSLITNLDVPLATALYGETPPLQQAKSDQDILAGLEKLADPEIRQALGQKAREWVLRHHAEEVTMPRLIQTYQDILKQAGLSWRGITFSP